jgi:hypothetical protein
MGWLDLTYAWFFELGGVMDERAKELKDRVPEFTFDDDARIAEDVLKLDGVQQTIRDARAEYLRLKAIPGANPFSAEVLPHHVTFRVKDFYKSLDQMDKAFLFLGSYEVGAHYGRGSLEIVVRNTSGWESGSRFRKGNKGMISDRRRDCAGIHVGGNIKQTFTLHVPWEEPGKK